jgi:hypothetical protein
VTMDRLKTMEVERKSKKMEDDLRSPSGETKTPGNKKPYMLIVGVMLI